MLRSRLDRIVFAVIVVILLVAAAVYGWQAYGNYLRHSLILAARRGDAASVKALLNRGVDPNTAEVDPKVSSLPKTHFGRLIGWDSTTIEWALKAGDINTVRVLFDKGARMPRDPVTYAAAAQNPEIAELLIAHGADIKEILERAAINGNLVLVRALLQHNPDLNAVLRDGQLTYAASQGDVTSVTTFLDAGVYVDTRDNETLTGLMNAVEAGQVETTALLLARGANVFATTLNGYTVGYFARHQHNPALSDMILQAEANAVSPEPKAILDLHKQADDLWYGGQSDAAMAIWRQIVSERPADLAARIHLARALLRQGELPAALQMMETAAQATPQNLQVHIYLGDMWFKQHRLDDAIAAYRTALRVNPNEFMARHGLASVLQQQGKLAEATAETRTLIAQHPANALAYYWLSDLLYRQGQRKEAIEACQKVFTNLTGVGIAWRHLGRMLLEDGQLEGALAACHNAARLMPQDAGAHAGLGRALTVQGNLDEAVRECQLALRLDPSMAEAHYNLGLALDKQGQRAQAIAELQLYVSQAQHNSEERERIADASNHLQQWNAKP